MPSQTQRFPYMAPTTRAGIVAEPMPYIPLLLIGPMASVQALGLLDSGATVNVLPYELGLRLGAQWERSTVRLTLSGNLARADARALSVRAKLGNLPVVELAFAWTKANDIPLLLGQFNFFAKFDLCFSRTQGFVEVRTPDSPSAAQTP